MDLTALFDRNELSLIIKIYEALRLRELKTLSFILLGNAEDLKPGEDNKFSIFSAYVLRLIKSELSEKEFKKLRKTVRKDLDYRVQARIWCELWLNTLNVNVVADFKKVVSFFCTAINSNSDYIIEDTSRGFKVEFIKDKPFIEIMPSNDVDRLTDHVWVCIDFETQHATFKSYMIGMYELIFNFEEVCEHFHKVRSFDYLAY